MANINFPFVLKSFLNSNGLIKITSAKINKKKKKTRMNKMQEIVEMYLKLEAISVTGQEMPSGPRWRWNRARGKGYKTLSYTRIGNR